MLTFLVGIASALIGAFISTRFDRFKVTWVKRRDAAAAAYEAVVATHTVLCASIMLARQVDQEVKKTNDPWSVAESASWRMRSTLDAMKERLETLSRVLFTLESIWGSEVNELFRRYWFVATAWHNYFASYHDYANGAPGSDEDDAWNPDDTGYDWYRVLRGDEPDAADFGHEIESLMDWIRRFARSAGVVAGDLMGLPWGAQEVVAEFQEARERAAARAARQLPPGR